eukprot:1264032-Amorphochlora_amoeboformis.AAC.1
MGLIGTTEKFGVKVTRVPVVLSLKASNIFLPPLCPPIPPPRPSGNQKRGEGIAETGEERAGLAEADGEGEGERERGPEEAGDFPKGKEYGEKRREKKEYVREVEGGTSKDGGSTSKDGEGPWACGMCTFENAGGTECE